MTFLHPASQAQEDVNWIEEIYRGGHKSACVGFMFMHVILGNLLFVPTLLHPKSFSISNSALGGLEDSSCNIRVIPPQKKETEADKPHLIPRGLGSPPAGQVPGMVPHRKGPPVLLVQLGPQQLSRQSVSPPHPQAPSASIQGSAPPPSLQLVADAFPLYGMTESERMKGSWGARAFPMTPLPDARRQSHPLSSVPPRHVKCPLLSPPSLLTALDTSLPS